MTNAELLQLAQVLWFTVCTNQRYHQKLQGKYQNYDWWLRVVTGLLATVTFFQSVFGNYAWGIAAAAASGLSAWLTALLSKADEARSHAELYQRWTDLRSDLEALELDLKQRDPEKGAGDFYPALFQRMKDRKNQIDSRQPPRNDVVWEECEGDQYEAVWGPGVRSHQQALDRKNARRK